MKREAIVAGILLAATLGFAIVGLGTIVRQPDKRRGEAFPSLALSSLQGRPVAFDGRDGPTVVTVFTTWCVPCREEFSKVANASNAPWASRIRFVEIDEGEPPSRVVKFLQSYPQLHATVLLDTSHAVRAPGFYSIPRTLAVSEFGKVAGHFDGEMGYGELRTLVSQANAKR